MKLHLACGEDHRSGFINVDRVQIEGVDQVWDLEQFPWPWADNSVEEILCQHYIEHTPMDTYGKRIVKIAQRSSSWEEFRDNMSLIDLEGPNDGLILFMEEVYRILEPKGSIALAFPYYQSDFCWRDPTHRRAITEATMFYFDKQWRLNSNLSHYPITSDFDVEFEGYVHFEDKKKFKTQKDRVFAIRHLNNVVVEMRVRLRKR